MAPPAAQDAGAADPGAQAYAQRCAMCHGAKREGNAAAAFPPLAGIQHKLNETQIAEIVHNGKGRMPAIPDLKDPELASILHFLTTEEAAPAGNGQPSSPNQIGQTLFRQNCGFCHGRDAMGGETGPDLTQSKLVLADKTGDMIAAVVRDGRPAKKMPAFKFAPAEMSAIEAFIQERVKFAQAHPGGRRGVAVEDLQTGNAEAGKQYFNGAGGCAKCHSPTGDLAGIASRLEGLRLEMRMLYPWDAKSKVTVTLPTGETISGLLAYQDEFTIGLRDANGSYRSWPTRRVHFKVDSPAEAHVEQFPKYTDADVHNLMAYLQTLK